MNPPSNFSSRDVLWALSNRDILRLRHWSLPAAEGTSPLKSKVTLDRPKSQHFGQNHFLKCGNRLQNHLILFSKSLLSSANIIIISKLHFHLTTNNSDSGLKLSYFSLILTGFESENIVFVSVEHEGVVAACFRCHQRVRRRKLRRTCNFQVSRMSRLEDRVSGFFL